MASLLPIMIYKGFVHRGMIECVMILAILDSNNTVRDSLLLSPINYLRPLRARTPVLS